MSNFLEGSARFEYGGRSYLLTINNRALLGAEAVLNESMIDFVERFKACLSTGRNPMVRDVTALGYGGLVQNHPDITQDAVIEMFFDQQDASFRDALLEALQGTEPPKDSGAVGKVQARAAEPGGTGKKSTGSIVKRAGTGKNSGKKRRAAPS